MKSKYIIGEKKHEGWREQLEWCKSAPHSDNWHELRTNVIKRFFKYGVIGQHSIVDDWCQYICFGLTHSESIELVQYMIEGVPIGITSRMGRENFMCDMTKTEEYNEELINRYTTDLYNGLI